MGRCRLPAMRSEAEPQEQIEAKLIYAPRRVWKKIERLAVADGRTFRRVAGVCVERGAQVLEAELEQVA